MQLEWLASTSDAEDTYPFDIATEGEHGGVVIDTRPIVRAVVDDAGRGEQAADMARRFHNTVADMTVRVTSQLHAETGIDDVVLTGGVFQNALLLESTAARLANLGLRVHTPSRVPANDGGLALGQLAVAAATLQGAF